MYGQLDISTSGMVAQRMRLDTIAANVANAQTTRDAQGRIAPYRRREAIFSVGSADGGPGVHVSKIREDPSPFKAVYKPKHPDADDRGIVKMPNIDMAVEMVDALAASRAYEANVTAIEVTKSMMGSTLRIIA